MNPEFEVGDRVTITRRVRDEGASSRQIKVVEDGVVLARRFGHRGQWVQVLSPASLDGRLLNFSPDNAEWFPVCSSYIRIVRTGIANSQ